MFEKLSAQLRGMSKDQLSQLDLSLLMDLMERSANGERVNIPSGSPLKPIQVTTTTTMNATLIRPATLKSEEKASSHVADSDDAPNPFSISPSNALPALAPISHLPHLPHHHPHHRKSSAHEEKDAMAGEVKRISLEYNEEKQKLDLMMKIQQARQRQSLQRKLFEKSQKKAQQQRQQQLGMYEGEDGDNYNYDYDEQADEKSEYNSVEIGANRGLSNMKAKQAASLQPAFKGLPADAYKSAPAAGGGAGYSSGKPQNQGMALRGLNLGPMMRK